MNNKGKMRKSGFFMKVFLVLVSLGWIDPLADKVREGNELYHRGAYDDALDKYVNARIDSPPLPQLDFNIAGTQYQRKKYDEAAQLFDKVVQSGNPEMQAKASFNMGNTLYRQGKMKEAMEYYKKAVDLADGLGYKGDASIDALKNDARYNYEFVERKIKENEQKQQQQGQDQEQKEQDQDQNDQQQKQDDKNNKEDQRQKEDKNEEKEQDKSQQNKQEPSPENTPESDSQNKEHRQAQPDKNKQKEQQAQQPQPTPHQGQRQMSKEEAERFLDALNHAEKETRQEMRDKQRLQHKSVEKDW